MRLSAVQKFSLLDFPGISSCIAFLPGCNFRCGYCHNSEFVLPQKIKELESSFISDETFFNFIEQRKGLLEGVVVSGGEPTVHLKLPGFLESIKNLGFKTKLDTNGSNPTMLRELIGKKLLDYVALDYKISLERYKELTLADVRDKISESISILNKSNVDWEVRITLIKELHNEKELSLIASELSNVPVIYLQGFRNNSVLDESFENFSGYTQKEMQRIKEDYFGNSDKVFIRK